jgi:AraC-like DNA-binding protein
MPNTLAESAHLVNTFVVHSFAEWRRLMSSRFVDLDVTTDRPDDFQARLRTRLYDGIGLSQIFAGSHLVDRPLSKIAPHESKYFKMSLQLSGTGIIVQDGREATLLPGDMAIYDTGRPYSMAFEDTFESMVLIFPQELVNVPAEAIAQLTAVRLSADSAIGQIVSPFLRQLGGSLDHFNGHSGVRIAHNTLDLISTLLYTELDLDNAAKQDTNFGLMSDIQIFIEQNLGHHELTPAAIAAHHYISTRRLHYLFQAEGTTVAAWIKTRRLERCRRDLQDPSLANETVTAIAQRWGFVEPAHFSRTFRAAFGLSPTDYRRTLGY